MAQRSTESAEHEDLPCACKPVAPEGSDRPCPVFLDVEFRPSSGEPRIEAISFENHFVSNISIYQKQDGNWVKVLKDEPLMRHAHYEDDAQRRHTLQAGRFLAPFDAGLKGADGALAALRFRLKQPSMLWAHCAELRNVRCVALKHR
ncbi:hypothetical protein M885DRAFT_522184 [Pelagophyceae sp. CCMP2097]|nr:hypothetical protein M885DRAFT_522184 [Pelagophyceae sp. CCMP2097]